MKLSIFSGHQLPESFEDFQSLVSGEGGVTYPRCEACGAPFSPANTFTAAGWRETQISGLCETCFDELMNDSED